LCSSTLQMEVICSSKMLVMKYRVTLLKTKNYCVFVSRL
jgi:hypothetical protein